MERPRIVFALGLIEPEFRVRRRGGEAFVDAALTPAAGENEEGGRERKGAESEGEHPSAFAHARFLASVRSRFRRHGG